MRHRRSVLFSLCALALAAAVATINTSARAAGNDLIVLKSFGNNSSTTSPYGIAPYGSVVRLPSGVLWGTASSGTITSGNPDGTVFDYNPATAEVATVENFGHTNKSSGARPYAPLILGADGDFYGVTEYGGANDLGTVFQVTPAGVYSVVYSFKGTTDGSNPYGGLVQGPDGSLYGTTLFSTASGGTPSGDGTIFKITTAGVLTQLHVFSGNDGSSPEAALTIASDGNLYGAAHTGGVASSTLSDYGVVFRIATSGANFTIIHTFAGGSDGGGPDSPLFQASNGLLYGTTNASDLPPYPTGYTPPAPANYGTIYSVSTSGAFASIASFSATDDNGVNTNGCFPSGALVQMSNGLIYGTVQNGGVNADGGVFVFNPSTQAAPTMVYAFTGKGDGAEPVGGATLGQDGNLYGTTSGGYSGISNGSIFEVAGEPIVTAISPTSVTVGSGQFQLTVSGSNFNPASAVVLVDGAALATESATPTQITATVPPGLVATVGGDSVVVENDPNLPVSTAQTLSVTTAAASIASIAPSSTLAGSPSFTLVINGLGFVASGESVTFAGTPLTISAATSTQIDAVVPASLIGSPGGAAVVVNDNNGSPASNSVAFAIDPYAGQPLITSLTPPSITAGIGSFVLTLSGSNFGTAGDTVTFDGSALSIVSQSATSIQATVPATLSAVPGIGDIVETNSSGETSNTATLTIKTPAIVAPVLTSLSPSSVAAGSAGFTLTIAGNGFDTAGVTVDFAGAAIPATSISGPQVKAAVPASLVASAGQGSVTVENASGGGLSNVLTFTVDPAVVPTPVHTFAAGLQMISLPDDFAGVSPISLLGASATLAVWNPATSAYDTTPTFPADSLRLGQGYWVRFGVGGANLYETGGQADPSVPYAIPLTAGWNMIGDPFATTAPLSAATFQVGSSAPQSFGAAVQSGLTTGSIFLFRTGDTTYEVYGSTAGLTPYYGYWIYVSKTCTMNVSAG